ncbi:MAG: hypothetical protein DIU72_002195 [Pseudomonadota bacterium]|nr:MAG: hypothetical protein DIU72_06050 [Pseudomonadota bacterium]
MDVRRWAAVLGAWALLCSCEAIEGLGTVAGARAEAVSYDGPCRFATDCPGRKCVRLRPNAQHLAGICSRSCFSDADCGEGGICFLLGRAGPTCLAKCGRSVTGTEGPEARACPPGLACVPVGARGEMACFVEPFIRASAGRGAG